MKNRKHFTIGLLVILLLSLAGGIASANDRPPMTPELAAKKEMVRKQREQKITPAKRRAAIERLKAERVKVYKARQDAQNGTPVTTDNK